MKKTPTPLKKHIGTNASTAQCHTSGSPSFQSLANDKSISVQYYLPSNIKEALVVLTTQQGERVRQLVLTNRGRSSVSINTATLAAGTYYYSLIADGASVDAKKLVVAR